MDVHILSVLNLVLQKKLKIVYALLKSISFMFIINCYVRYNYIMTYSRLSNLIK